MSGFMMRMDRLGKITARELVSVNSVSELGVLCDPTFAIVWRVKFAGQMPAATLVSADESTRRIDRRGGAERYCRSGSTTAAISLSPCPAAMPRSNARSAVIAVSRSNDCRLASSTA